MNTYAKLAIAAAALVVVAVVGINLMPARGGVGSGPTAASPSPSPSVTPAPTSSPSPTAKPAIVFPPSGELAQGSRHSMTLVGHPLTLTIPTKGWISNGQWGIDKTGGIGPDGAGFIFWPAAAPVGVYADPCASVAAPPVGSSTADMAAAIAKVSGTDLVSGPKDVIVGGHPAKQVVIKVREDVGCDPSAFYLWYAPTQGDARYATRLGDTIRVWIIDVDGTRVQFDGETHKGAGPGPGQEIQQIVDSIQFE